MTDNKHPRDALSIGHWLRINALKSHDAFVHTDSNGKKELYFKFEHDRPSVADPYAFYENYVGVLDLEGNLNFEHIVHRDEKGEPSDLEVRYNKAYSENQAIERAIQAAQQRREQTLAGVIGKFLKIKTPDISQTMQKEEFSEIIGKLHDKAGKDHLLYLSEVQEGQIKNLGIAVSGKLHDAWQKDRPKTVRDGIEIYEPMFKEVKDEKFIAEHTEDTETIKHKDGKVLIDMANTSFEDLPLNLQKENIETSISLARTYKQNMYDFDKINVEIMASKFHTSWMKRNPMEKSNAHQHVPYEQLSQEDKNRNLKQVLIVSQEILKDKPHEAALGKIEKDVALEMNPITPEEAQMALSQILNISKKFGERKVNGYSPKNELAQVANSMMNAIEMGKEKGKGEKSKDEKGNNSIGGRE